MEKLINVVIDASGSMVEDGKSSVVQYILNGLNNVREHEEFKNYKFSLFQWSEESKELESLERIKLEFKGKADVKGLNKLKDLLDMERSILLISDGNFNRPEKEKLKNFKARIIPIFIGIDANKAFLKDISSNKVVYSGVDLVQALKEL